MLEAELPHASFIYSVNLFIFVCSICTWLDLRLEPIEYEFLKPFFFIGQRSQVFQSSHENLISRHVGEDGHLCFLLQTPCFGFVTLIHKSVVIFLGGNTTPM